jgi:ABC-type sulfate/molybdate transport systems ATPase subunit
VDWRLRQGEFWVVGGPPGSGKSSLLATAAGLNRPAAGTLRMFGQDLATATEADQVAWRRRIGFVYEPGGRLLLSLTVAENVALPPRYHTETGEADVRAQVGAWLDRTGLAGFADAPPSRLQPRQQHRLALARAVIVMPAVLFVDSPLTNLDPAEAAWWRAQLGALHAAGLTVVVGSNDPATWRAPGARCAAIANESFQEV